MTRVEFERQYAAAVTRGKARLRAEPRARSTYYDSASRRVVVELRNGCVLMCPVDLLQGLRGAPDAALADVELMPRGLDLRWKKLDTQFTVAGLLRGVSGTRAWMAELGRAGGRVTSPAKRVAARANGRLGGARARAPRGPPNPKGGGKRPRHCSRCPGKMGDNNSQYLAGSRITWLPVKIQ